MGLARTKIPWTDYVYNPTSGCSHGCKWCYAARMAGRFGRSFAPTCHPERLDLPLRTRKPGRVFVDSNGDLFDPAIPDEFIDQVFSVMETANWHTYQILTKQADRMQAYAMKRAAHHDGFERGHAPNIWLGVSATNQPDADERIPLLMQTPAAVRFASVEPLLGAVGMDGMLADHEWEHGVPGGVNWLIVGAMTGPGAKPPKREWIQNIVNQCQAARVALFLKENLRPIWQGELIQQWPEVAEERTW